MKILYTFAISLFVFQINAQEIIGKWEFREIDTTAIHFRNFLEQDKAPLILIGIDMLHKIEIEFLTDNKYSMSLGGGSRYFDYRKKKDLIINMNSDTLRVLDDDKILFRAGPSAIILERSNKENEFFKYLKTKTYQNKAIDSEFLNGIWNTVEVRFDEPISKMRKTEYKVSKAILLMNSFNFISSNTIGLGILKYPRSRNYEFDSETNQLELSPETKDQSIYIIRALTKSSMIIYLPREQAHIYLVKN